MSNPFLLSRVLLQFKDKSDDLIDEISAATFTPDGSLWLGSDEALTIERLSPIEPGIFGKHESFFLGDFIELFNNEDEIDIEGISYANNYLWIIGSHSTKRGRPRGKNTQKDLQRLATIKTDINRYLLCRIPVIQGELVKSSAHPDNPNRILTAACLEKTETSNILIEALKEDSHLSPFLTWQLPSKDNGLDIEGLAVCGDRVFLGLRGPVLRGWALILELEVVERETGVLTLKEIGEKGIPYKKHFLDLNGLGVRELCFDGEDMIILGGPTMMLDGLMRVFRLQGVLNLDGDSLSSANSKQLEILFDLPLTLGCDRAEGLTLFPCLGESNSLLVFYDSPSPHRQVAPHGVYGDVFRQ
ncbi:MAG TPA: DUF3616 domain-containing protein [Cyanobacteria bacterium UBA11149]|nr:DUF3616 domain-containing protein [Cyanobacteria bacterium UBA11367]HBE58411.1 DUF3616 domain-containing protein [Cyanobacteria bacterium UBA11366]HBK62118.1 DUF3616 domain-containing protein [Cyanobacteria bacterium UBA11166]HBS69899.1 DUF3616 domain-containing protein [Cyanobacteria bacterium UBA11153]HBW87992.1 DUF3616 domain-containing protein [Cyanobacteria bacterium UBA11149]HCA94414.1 DUF3616 domain-containing protein [Cyanobacteria bacterium UBA9226]